VLLEVGESVVAPPLEVVPELMSGNASEVESAAPLLVVESPTIVSVVVLPADSSTLGKVAASVPVEAVASVVSPEVAAGAGKVSAGGISVTVVIPPGAAIGATGWPVPLLFVAGVPGVRVDEPSIGVPGSTLPGVVASVVSTVVVVVVVSDGAASPRTISLSVGVRRNSAMTRLMAVVPAVEAEARTSAPAIPSGTVVVADKLRNAVCPSAEYIRPVIFTESALSAIVIFSSTKE
jgi:hypothetical protein